MTERVGRASQARQPAASQARQFFRPDIQRDVDDEIAAHLEMRERELRERGLLPGDARQAAVRRFGNVAAVASECRRIDEAWYRGQRRASMWMDLRQDITYALRMVFKAPGFAAVALVTLALGIGGSTAIFSVIESALLRPLPYSHPEQLVDLLIEENRAEGKVSRFGPSLEDVRAWQADRNVFSHVTRWRSIFGGRVLDGPEPERVNGLQIDEQYLPLFGVAPMLGRGFTYADTERGAEPVVMLGYAFWQRRFGSDPNVIGQTILLDNTPATVVGVLPPSFFRTMQLLQPLQTEPAWWSHRGTGGRVYARLAPGITIEQAQRRLSDTTKARDLAQNRKPADGVAVDSLYTRATFGYRQTTDILAAAVGAILLIACINVAGLLLARGALRTSELAVRASLGAGRHRLARQLLTESVVLALMGGAAGVLLAWVTLDLLVANIPLSLPPNSPPALNLRVLAFAGGLSLFTGMFFGLVPAWSLSRVNLAATLSRASGRHGSALSRRGGQLLIASEIAVAIVLLAGAGLMIRSFSRMVSVDVGFDPDAVVTMEVVPVDPKPDVLARYYPALVESLLQLPDVEAVGAVNHLPLAGSSTMVRGTIDGQPVSLNIREFVAGYFDAIGFRVTHGRVPSAAETTAAVPPALINEQAARQLFPSGAIGRRFEIHKTTYHVVGVFADVRHDGPLFPAKAEVYVPMRASADGPMIVVIKARGENAALHAQLRQAAHALGTRVVVQRIRPGTEWLGDRVVTPRRRTVLLTLLGGLGLVLALVGVFGMTAYAVARRTREIGVRMALGATRRQVVRDIVADALWPIVIGAVAGVGGAMLATRLIASFLFDTPPTHAGTFAVVTVLMMLTAWTAAWVPSRRAATVDPVKALRVE